MPLDRSGFSWNSVTRPLVVGRYDAEAMCFFGRHRNNADRQVGATLLVLLQQRAEIHVVHLVARKQQHRVAVRVGQTCAVLVQRAGGTAIDILRKLIAKRLPDKQAVRPAPVEIPWPAEADVVEQRLGAVVGEQRNAPQARVDGIGKREVDDAVFARERQRRLGAMCRQDTEPPLAAAGQD